MAFFGGIYRKSSFPLSKFALTLLGGVLWQIFTLSWIPVAFSKRIWHRLGAQAASRQKSTLHSTLSICCADWVAWLLLHGREGWLTFPEQLITGQFELREISVKTDHKECIREEKLCFFYSFLTSSGWIFLLMGSIKQNILAPQRNAATHLHSCS